MTRLLKLPFQTQIMTSTTVKKQITQDTEWRFWFHQEPISPDFVGNFGIREHTGTYHLYNLDEFDQENTKDIKLKDGEKIYRADTQRSRMMRLSYLVKINTLIDRVYFIKEWDMHDDKIFFDSKGVKLDHLNLK